MRCLFVLLVILAIVGGTAVLAWNWHGWWGLLGWVAGCYVLLWLLARFGPGASASAFRGMFRVLAGSMRGAVVTVHSVEPAFDSDPVEEVLQGFDEWLKETAGDDELDGVEAQADPSGAAPPFPGAAHFDVDEYLTHSEIDLTLRRYRIDVTISPPASEPDAEWAPHAVSLVPLHAEHGRSCEVLEIEQFDPTTSAFRPLNLGAFEEIRGARRLRMLVALDPAHRDYRFEYLHVSPLEATVHLPEPDDGDDPVRRVTVAILDRAAGIPRLETMSLNSLPVTDSDLERFCGRTELEYLGLDRTQVTDAGLRHLAGLTGLQQLSLEWTQVTDAGLKQLAALTGLKRLFVRQTAVTAAAAAELREVLPKLKIFSGSLSRS